MNVTKLNKTWNTFVKNMILVITTMMNKPENHCDCGTYTHTIPIPIKGKVQYIDFCVADIVSALTAGNIETVASCCGHGKIPGSILLKDGRNLIINKWNGHEEDGKIIEFINSLKK